MDVASELALPLGESREATREQHAKKDLNVPLRMSEVLEAVGWCMCAPCFRLALLNLLAHRSG